MTGPELRSNGYSGNNGITDQINAFLWIKKFISGFGGDLSNVTAVGESCGGVSAMLLLYHREPLFRRVISMGGHALLMAPVPLEVADIVYMQVLKSLGIDSLTSEKRLEKLQSLGHEEIIAKLPMTIPNRPVIDGDLFTSQLTSAEVEDPDNRNLIPGRAWCQEILIGDCLADVCRVTKRAPNLRPTHKFYKADAL